MKRLDQVVGPYFSADAGGVPNRLMGGPVGQAPATPPLNLPGIEEAFGMLSSINFLPIGTFTPWAEQVGDASFVALSTPPATNVVLYDLSAVANILESLGYGEPGYVAFLTYEPLTLGFAESAFTGTHYRYWGAEAVFSQSDQAGIPKVYFLYWGSLRDPGDPSGGSGSIIDAAQSVGGQLVFGMQLGREQSGTRWPGVPFDAAFATQFPLLSPAAPPSALPPPAPPPAPPPPPPEEVAPAPPPDVARGDFGMAFALGGAVAVVTYLVMSSRGRRR